MTTYIALIRKEADSDFGVEFPDFPGCVTAGRTLDEALVMAHEALALYVEDMVAEGEALPEPSPVEQVLGRPDAGGAVPTLVRVPAIKARAIRLNITLEQPLLARIDAVVGKGERSAFLAEAARAALEGAGRRADTATMPLKKARARKKRSTGRRASGSRPALG